MQDACDVQLRDLDLAGGSLVSIPTRDPRFAALLRELRAVKGQEPPDTIDSYVEDNVVSRMNTNGSL